MLRTHPERILRPFWWMFSIWVEICIMQMPIMKCFLRQGKRKSWFCVQKLSSSCDGATIFLDVTSNSFPLISFHLILSSTLLPHFWDYLSGHIHWCLSNTSRNIFTTEIFRILGGSWQRGNNQFPLNNAELFHFSPPLCSFLIFFLMNTKKPQFNSTNSAFI